MKRTYIIIEVNDITDDMIKESLNNESSFRTSQDGLKALLKFGIKFPISMKGYTKYTHSEILIEMNKIEWSGT